MTVLSSNPHSKKDYGGLLKKNNFSLQAIFAGKIFLPAVVKGFCYISEPNYRQPTANYSEHVKEGSTLINISEKFKLRNG